MKIIRLLLFSGTLSLCAFQMFGSPQPDDLLFRKQNMLTTMKKVADWQIQNWQSKGFKYKKTDWTNAAAYAGIFDFGRIAGDEQYHKSLVAIGEELNWNTGSRRLMADDYCIGQTYSLLYTKYHEPKMIAPFQHLADSIVSLPFNEPLKWVNQVHNREWAWCDALFMGPPALAYLSTATGDMKYLEKAGRLFWKTTDFLYDDDEHLYFRDERFFTQKEKNGKKIFWSRGNGWVLGGMARVLENMPAKYAGRKKFEKHFKEFAEKIASLQQPDGSWHASLLDPDSYPVKETSGTGFYCYGLMWGINNGILKKSKYLPVVKKAWAVLTSSVQSDGMLGFVQPIGAAPDKVSAQTTDVYGVGAFLLAGTQIYYYLDKHRDKM